MNCQVHYFWKHLRNKLTPNSVQQVTVCQGPAGVTWRSPFVPVRNNSHKKQQCLWPNQMLLCHTGTITVADHRAHHRVTEAWRGAELYVYCAIQEEREELNPLYACFQLRKETKPFLAALKSFSLIHTCTLSRHLFHWFLA